MPMRRAQGREGAGGRARKALSFSALRAAAALLAFVVLGCLPAPARATETARLNIGFSPYRLGSGTTVEIALNLGVAGTPGGLPAPVTSFDLQIPADLELIGSSLGLAICKPQALLASGPAGCSPNARLGFGTAQINVPVGPEPVSEPAMIEAEMGPPVGEEVSVLLYADAQAPVAAQLIFPGVLFEGAGAQGLNTSVPPIPTVPGASDASMLSMSLSLGPNHLTYYEKLHGRTVAYRPQGISLPAKCPRKGFRFVSNIAFQDATTVTASSTVACPPSRRRR
jgi:hypothetical protein